MIATISDLNTQAAKKRLATLVREGGRKTGTLVQTREGRHDRLHACYSFP